MVTDVVRRVFHAYEIEDRSAIEPLLADDFTFTSPYDDHIDRSTYFERCWSNAGAIAKFELHQIVVEGDVALVVYTGTRRRGGQFHNTERFVFSGDQVAAVEVFFGLPPSSQPELAPEVAIRAVLAQRAQAMEQHDARALTALYADDAVWFSLAPPLSTVGAALHDPVGLERWFAGWKGPLQTELRDLRIDAAGELGFATALQRLVATSNDDARTDLWMRATYCFRKETGVWKIVSVHESVPFAMDGSLRALLDLQP